MNRRYKTLLILLAGVSTLRCDSDQNGLPVPDRAFRDDMRSFVGALSEYARAIQPGFIVVPQNGNELITDSGDSLDSVMTGYLSSIDGMGREDLFYGYDDDNQPTPAAESNYLIPFLDLAEAHGIEILVTDYCSTPAFVDDSYERNLSKGYTPFAANHRELDDVPPYPADPVNVNSNDITILSNAQNFLYLINPGAFADKTAYLNALNETDYDLLILDLFYEQDDPLLPGETASIKIKANGGTRLLLAYMSIGEAESYRYYWQDGWKTGDPEWLDRTNPKWENNYKVRYWDPEWQNIIFGNDASYLKQILDAGFDGVYLDIIDAYEYFEDQL